MAAHRALFRSRCRSRIPHVAEGLAELYGQFEVRSSHEAFADFHVELNPPTTLRRWFRPQVGLFIRRRPAVQAAAARPGIPMLEWGLNWCVSSMRIIT